jgi:hypothetical protein
MIERDGLRSRRFRVRRALPALAALGILAAAVSCILADPPPALPTIPPQPPVIYGSSSVPPTTSLITGTGSLSFSVPVGVDFNTSFYVFVDYGTPASTFPSAGQQPKIPMTGPIADGGGVQLVDFTLEPPLPPTTCHTITLFADVANDSPEKNTPAALTCAPLSCSYVSWIYDPSGAGLCPEYDAGGVPDADKFREAAPGDALSDTTIIIPTE